MRGHGRGLALRWSLKIFTVRALAVFTDSRGRGEGADYFDGAQDEQSYNSYRSYSERADGFLWLLAKRRPQYLAGRWRSFCGHRYLAGAGASSGSRCVLTVRKRGSLFSLVGVSHRQRGRIAQEMKWERKIDELRSAKKKSA